jgi:hypothetical protein
VAKWLIEQGFDESGATVRAEHEATLFEAGEVATNAGGGGANLFHQFLNRDIPGAEQGFNDAVCANVRFG